MDAFPNLPSRLENQAVNVEQDGWITAARLMREAAAELRQRRAADADTAPEEA